MRSDETYQRGRASLGRRDFAKGLAAAGAISAGGLASSGTVAAADEHEYCLANDGDHGCALDGGIETVQKAIGWLTGSGGDDDPVEEYNGNEWLRIHGDAYLEAIETYASNQTTTTWLEDNAQYSEGAAYTSALKTALREIKENAATRTEAQDAAEQAVLDHYSVAQREMIEEFHLHLRRYRRQLELLDGMQSEVDSTLTDVLHLADTPEQMNHLDESGGDLHTFDPGVSQVTYDLLNGETVDVPSMRLDFDIGESGTGWYPDEYEGVLALNNFSPQSPSDNTLIQHKNSDESVWDPATKVTLFVDSFDRATYNNVYDASIPESAVDGQQVFVDLNMWNDVATTLLSTKDAAVSNVRTFIDNVYDDVVDSDLTYEDIVTHEMLVKDASDDDPLARANAHLGLIGHSPANSHTTIRFPDLLDGSSDNETNTTNTTVGGEYTYADLGTDELEGTIFVRPQPTDPIEVGKQYTVSDLGGDSTVEVMLTYATVDADGNRTANMIELEQSDTFEIVEAKRLNDNGELVSVDQIEFSGSAPTETPTNYDEMHQKLDQMETFNKEVLAQQRKLIEKMAEKSGGGAGGGGGANDTLLIGGFAALILSTLAAMAMGDQ